MHKDSKIKTVEKKVYCYEIENTTPNLNIGGILDLYRNKIGTDWSNLNKDLLYSKGDIKFFMEVIRIDKYLDEDFKEYSIYSLILYKLKENDFPFLMNLKSGQKSKLTIDKDDALLEQTHALIIPEMNIMLMEDNYIGANARHIPLIFISALGSGITNDLKINHICNHKTIEKLKQSSQIKSYVFKFGQQGMNTLSEILPLGIIEQTAELYCDEDDLVFEVIVKNKRRGQPINKDKGLIKKITDAIPGIKNNRDKNDILKVNINLIDEKFPLNMLEEYVLQEVIVNKLDEKSKYLDTDDMFKKLIELYNRCIFTDKQKKLQFHRNIYEGNLITFTSKDQLAKEINDQIEIKKADEIESEAAQAIVDNE